MIGDSAQNKLDEELMSWIDTIPFSKPAKNLTRDFSDGVLTAEILKFYYPRYVELHNYVSASNLNMKVENWNTLNRKVLPKLNLKLSRERISNLANASQGSIEKLLTELKVKILRDHQQELRRQSVESVRMSKEKVTDDMLHDKLHLGYEENVGNPEIDGETQRSASPKVRRLRIFTVFGWIISLFRIWSVFSYIFSFKFLRFGKYARNVSSDLVNKSKIDNTVKDATYIALKQELREKEEIICALNHKIMYLESSLKLSNLRISGLMEQIVQNTSK